MKISLETVKEMLQDALGLGRFVDGSVAEVVEDSAIPPSIYLPL
jgi:hypothetical protein